MRRQKLVCFLHQIESAGLGNGIDSEKITGLNRQTGSAKRLKSTEKPMFKDFLSIKQER